MIRHIKRWIRGCGAREKDWQQSHLRGPSGYPIDMVDDCVETIRRVRPFTMTTPERVNGLCEAVRYITAAGIEGDIVECGVWKGGSMMAVAEMLGRLGDQDRRLHLFDTFQGMPQPGEQDVSFEGHSARSMLDQQRGKDPDFVWCGASLDEVRRNLGTTGYPADRIHFVPGMVEQTIPARAPDKIALLRLDTDWYESTRHELQHLFPRITDGGVLIIDDYGHWAGARRAVDEYLENSQVAVLLNRLDYTGRIGIVNRAVKRRGGQQRPAAA